MSLWDCLGPGGKACKEDLNQINSHLLLDFYCCAEDRLTKKNTFVKQGVGVAWGWPVATPLCQVVLCSLSLEVCVSLVDL